MNYADKNRFADGGFVDRRDAAWAARGAAQAKPKPKKKIKFGIEELASGLTNPQIQGFASGSDYLGGVELAKSIISIGQGKGGFFDFLSLASVIPGIGKVPGVIGTGGRAVRSAISAGKIKSLDDAGMDSLVASMYTKKDSSIKIDSDRISEKLVPTYTIGKDTNPLAFIGQGQDLSGYSQLGANVVKASSEGLLRAALKIDPKNKKVATMLANFQNNKIGKNELNFLDRVYASVAISKRGTVNDRVDADGFAEILASLTGNKNAKILSDFKTSELQKVIKGNIAAGRSARMQAAKDSPLGVEDFTSPSNVAVIHSTKYPVNRNTDGSIDLFANADKTEKYLPDYSRNSIHFTLEDIVKSHMQGTWPKGNNKIVTPLSSMLKNNGAPRNLLPIDTWWMRSPGEPLRISDSSVIRPFANMQEYKDELIKRGLYDEGIPGSSLPIIAVDPKTNDVLHYIKDATPSKKTIDGIMQQQVAAGKLDGINIPNLYTALDRKRIYEASKKYGINNGFGRRVDEGQEAQALEEISLEIAKKQVGINAPAYRLGEHSLNNPAREWQIRGIATMLGSKSNQHTGTIEQILEQPKTNSDIIIGDSIESLRGLVMRGKLPTFVKNIFKDYAPEAASGGLMKNGNFVVPKNFAMGGMVMPKNTKKSRAVSIKSLFRAANVDKSGTSRVDTPISPETLALLKDKYPASLGVFKDKENYFTRDGVSGGATYNDPFMQSYYNQKFLHGITAKPTIARNILSAWAATGHNKGLMSGEGALGDAASLYRYIMSRAKRGTSGNTPGQEMIRDQINRAYLGIEELYNSVQKRSMGGLVKPKYFANGDLARGTDVVPAMLTPGEFVMTKHAVDNYGVDNLRAINSGAAPGNSVYNGYNINVNVRSNSNPDQIANAVMTQIRQVNAQQVRGSKF
jgi:hypothetical protein